MLSSRRTAKTAAAQAGIRLRDVAEVTGFPEIIDGRVGPCIP